MKNPVSAVDTIKYSGLTSESVQDILAGEEPLEIRLKYFDGITYREKRLAVTMRTPGHDFELVIGFLMNEGIIPSYKVVEKIFYCESVHSEEEKNNVVIVALRQDFILSEAVFNRNFYVSSSCGVCGKSSLESIKSICTKTFNKSKPVVSPALLHAIPDLAGKDQTVFKHTGGLHASALFNTAGEMVLIREDIGRHNALDKVTGAREIAGLDNSEMILFLSGRAGFELVQKCIMAGIPIMVAVGAPSNLAVSMARSYNLTLVGFARKNKFNVYSGSQRIG